MIKCRVTKHSTPVCNHIYQDKTLWTLDEVWFMRNLCGLLQPLFVCITLSDNHNPPVEDRERVDKRAFGGTFLPVPFIEQALSFDILCSISFIFTSNQTTVVLSTKGHSLVTQIRVTEVK